MATTGDYEAGVSKSEEMFSRANHVGLFSEEIDPATGKFLIALINCAHVVARLDPAQAGR